MSTITNLQARTLWLHLQGMAAAPCGKRQRDAFAQRINALGMVQLDSIGILSRAHHHILWSRQSAYRSKDYDHLLQDTRSVFEHFSHDAVILPMSTYPFWQRQLKRYAAAYLQGKGGRKVPDPDIQKQVLKHIERRGPVCSSDLSELQKGPVDKSKHAWMRPSHKRALDYLWLTGTLSVSHREKFRKYYDLTSQVIPDDYREQRISEQEQLDWLCRSALERLGFANASELQRFWDATEMREVQDWLATQGNDIVPIHYVDFAGNSVQAIAPADIHATLANLPRPSTRVRIVNPFDPVVRDRNRLKRLFGFDYRIEIYTPPTKRQYGYYVYPMLEGSRFVGRIDVRADREKDALVTRAWWLEPGIKDTAVRREKIHKELHRLARLANVSHILDLPDVSQHLPATHA